VGNVEAIDRLHQPAYRFLEKVGVGEAVMAKALGDVGREADIGAGEPVLVVDVSVAKSANGDDLGALISTVFANELGHWPRFKRRADGTQFAWKMAEEYANELTLTVPEAGQQFALFFGS
jgi:hypothetical protein